ncbi:hypothetical protein ARMSODRAFT_1070962 [Armillaria solidipes]|uniref:Uncharacterized protein n=1 Tax=Armillaria solidipes TaxID=1076256 RepID=A0A2H3B7N8_9AGAR|nr:hypothetical protein ARMSODRAFT_1070962 [Armillaria solidipes]
MRPAGSLLPARSLSPALRRALVLKIAEERGISQNRVCARGELPITFSSSSHCPAPSVTVISEATVPEEVSDLILEFVWLDHPSYYTALLHSCSHIKIFYYPTRHRLFRFIRYDPSSYDLLLVIFSKNIKLSSFVQILALDAKHIPDIHKLSHLTAVRTLFLYSEGPRPTTISAEVLDRPVPMTHVHDVLLFNVTLDINGFRKLLHLCPGWTELGTENAVITDVPGGIDGNDCVRQYHFKRIPTRPRQSLSRRSSMESDAKVG